jgi:hypothetical protein
MAITEKIQGLLQAVQKHCGYQEIAHISSYIESLKKEFQF